MVGAGPERLSPRFDIARNVVGMNDILGRPTLQLGKRNAEIAEELWIGVLRDTIRPDHCDRSRNRVHDRVEPQVFVNAQPLVEVRGRHAGLRSFAPRRGGVHHTLVSVARLRAPHSTSRSVGVMARPSPPPNHGRRAPDHLHDVTSPADTSGSRRACTTIRRATSRNARDRTDLKRHVRRPSVARNSLAGRQRLDASALRRHARARSALHATFEQSGDSRPRRRSSHS